MPPRKKKLTNLTGVAKNENVAKTQKKQTSERKQKNGYTKKSFLFSTQALKGVVFFFSTRFFKKKKRRQKEAKELLLFLALRPWQYLFKMSAALFAFLIIPLLKETFITQHQRGGGVTTAPPFDFNSINWKNGGQNMITYAETKKKSIFWENCTLYRENKNQIKTHFRWKKQEISLKIKLQGAPNLRLWLKYSCKNFDRLIFVLPSRIQTL